MRQRGIGGDDDEDDDDDAYFFLHFFFFLLLLLSFFASFLFCRFLLQVFPRKIGHRKHAKELVIYLRTKRLDAFITAREGSML